MDLKVIPYFSFNPEELTIEYLKTNGILFRTYGARDRFQIFTMVDKSDCLCGWLGGTEEFIAYPLEDVRRFYVIYNVETGEYDTQTPIEVTSEQYEFDFNGRRFWYQTYVGISTSKFPGFTAISLLEAETQVLDYYYGKYSAIYYQEVNLSLDGPKQVKVGANVSIPVSIPEGYTYAGQSVYNQDGVIASDYNESDITFTAPSYNDTSPIVDFMLLPETPTTVIADTSIGTPFSDNAYFLNFTTAIATHTDTTMYATNVGGNVTFVCNTSGQYGITWIRNSLLVTEWECTSTSYNTIYAVQTTVKAYNLTRFPDMDTMLASFENTVVHPHSGAIVVYARALALDPMDDGGTSGTELPTGDFNEDSDEIPEPSMPTISAQNSGLVTLFRPSIEQVNALGQYVWTHIDDFIANLQKWVSNPVSYLVGFHVVPVVPSVDEERNIYMGNFLTPISMPPCVSQWYTYYFGSVQIVPYSGTYLDYTPYTKIQLFLPFIGSVSLNTDEVMGTLLGLKYRIDLLSGQCVAMLSVNGSYLYQWTGECSSPIPLTGNDWSRVYAAAVGAVGAVAGGAVGAYSGMGSGSTLASSARDAGIASLRTATQAGNAFSRLNKISGAPAMRERMATVADMAIENARRASEQGDIIARGRVAGQISSAVSGTVNSVMGAKQYISHSGTVTGSAGMLGIKQPFVLIEYPNQSLAENYKHFVGYPSNISGKLSEFSGYTECEQVVPSGFTGTDGELAEVLSLLKEGVYL